MKIVFVTGVPHCGPVGLWRVAKMHPKPPESVIVKYRLRAATRPGQFLPLSVSFAFDGECPCPLSLCVCVCHMFPSLGFVFRFTLSRPYIECINVEIFKTKKSTPHAPSASTPTLGLDNLFRSRNAHKLNVALQPGSPLCSLGLCLFYPGQAIHSPLA